MIRLRPRIIVCNKLKSLQVLMFRKRYCICVFLNSSNYKAFFKFIAILDASALWKVKSNLLISKPKKILHFSFDILYNAIMNLPMLHQIEIIVSQIEHSLNTLKNFGWQMKCCTMYPNLRNRILIYLFCIHMKK